MHLVWFHVCRETTVEDMYMVFFFSRQLLMTICRVPVSNAATV